MTLLNPKKRLPILIVSLVISASLFACSAQTTHDADQEIVESEGLLSIPRDLEPAEIPEGEKLRVVATTSIVADVVANVGGEAIEVTALMSANVDPHSYEPTPSDLREVSDAHVLFTNGLGLEEFVDDMIENVAKDVPVISLSSGLDAHTFEEEDLDSEEHPEEEEESHAHGAYDPHVWFDPTNVMIWAERIAQTLSQLDPKHTSIYESNVADYHEKLSELDQWIFVSVSHIPSEKRKLVTDHRVFEYFADRYGFEIVGAVIPVFSSAAEPSAREIADLQERIMALDIRVLFVGEAIHQSIVEAIKLDTGTHLVYLYTGALSGPEGPAGNYIDYMHYNVEAIVSALQE